MTEEAEFNKSRRSTNRAQILVKNLESLLGSIYADMDVPRSKVNDLISQGRELTLNQDGWYGGAEEIDDFRRVLDRLEKKLNQALDLKKLKDEGLVKAVSF